MRKKITIEIDTEAADEDILSHIKRWTKENFQNEAQINISEI